MGFNRNKVVLLRQFKQNVHGIVIAVDLAVNERLYWNTEPLSNQF